MYYAERQKGGMMSQLFTVGRVLTDPELKVSGKRTPYTHFTIVERVGAGAHAHDQFFRVWAWGPLANRLIQAGVRKRSLIWAAGSLELEEFSRKDTGQQDKQLRLTLTDWGFLPAQRRQGGEQQSEPNGPETADEPRERASIIYGDREALPGQPGQENDAV